MGRWAPDARSRLEQAALSLYTERGFTSTTVAEIAERAGLTERTFFRHFADKREVLFAGEGGLQDLFVGSLASSPSSLSPLDAVASSLAVVAADFQERAATVHQRAAVIAANPELRERELIKLAVLASALAEAFRLRGLDQPTASLAGEVAVAIFKNAFERWVLIGPQASFAAIVGECLIGMRTLAANPVSGGPVPGRGVSRAESVDALK